jgi:glycosyltransferase involved in cell wall biosynthesis
VRVIHVVPAISAKLGAPGNVTTFIRHLSRWGVDATLLTTNADPDGRLDVPLLEPVIIDGATCIFHDVVDSVGRYWLAPSLMRTLRRMVPSCDLVHIHWLYNFSSIAAARVALAAGVPFVVQPRGSLDPHLRKKNRLVKRVYMATVGRALLRKADAVIFTAEQERLIAEYRPRRPEWVIPVGVDAERFAHLPPKGLFRAAFPVLDGPFLLFLGRLSAQKGLDLLLGAFQRLLTTRPELQLVLAGPDYRGFRAEVEGWADALGVRHRVLFPGLLDHNMKLAAFVDAELFVLSSYAENFGVVVIEALACGLPVVISDQVNIHQELATEGMATVVECTVPSVADGIDRALGDADGRRRVSTAGPAFVRRHYTWDAIVPGLIAHYRELTHG